MSKLSRLQDRKERIEARIAEIEAALPVLTKYKSYSEAFGEISTTYQDYKPLAESYYRYLDDLDNINDQIADIQENEQSATGVAAFL